MTVRPDLSDGEFAKLLIEMIERVRGKPLSGEEKDRLLEIVKKEREGIERWALKGYLRRFK